jgi:hypothetical protein
MADQAPNGLFRDKGVLQKLGYEMVPQVMEPKVDPSFPLSSCPRFLGRSGCLVQVVVGDSRLRLAFEDYFDLRENIGVFDGVWES